MSTHALESAVLPLPVEKAWKHIRNFTFPEKLFPSQIKSVEIEAKDTPTSVGAIRKITWKTGEVRKDRLLAIDDQYYKITWEVIEGNEECSAIISSVQLHRITETNQTLATWSADFSSDATNEFILYQKKAFLENLKEMKETLAKE